MAFRNLKLLDAAEQVADEINKLIDRKRRPRLLHTKQMRDAIQSVVANIAEGFGRGTRRERDRSLRTARGETEEVIRHLAANYRADRLDEKEYWPVHNKLVTVVKMANALMNG